jgi:hypothetical protein
MVSVPRRVVSPGSVSPATVVPVEGSVAEATESKVFAKYAARDDLAAYGNNGLLLFSLQLRHGVEDHRDRRRHLAHGRVK